MTVRTSEFQDLYKAHVGLVRRVIGSFRFTNGTADDLAQQTFLKAYERLETLKDPKLFSPWIATIARNYCLQDLRREKGVVPIKSSDADDEDRSGVSGYEIGLWVDPEEQQAELEIEDNLALLARLLRDYRKEPRGTIARFYYVDGLNTREISEKTEMPQSTVLSHLHKFRREIKEALVGITGSLSAR